MSESIIFVVFVALVLGQLVAIRFGPVVAISYWLIVAPLDYFAVWMLATWDLLRVCGVVLLIYLHGHDRVKPPAAMPPSARPAPPMPLSYFAFTTYGVLITLALMAVWPTNTIDATSTIYTSFRGAIQIFNWLLVLLLAWKIAPYLADPTIWNTIRHGILMWGGLLCLYAVYQMAANALGLPLTGIRRPIIELEDTAKYLGAGDVVYRPCSLVGEPKQLGGLCVVWLTLVALRPSGSPWRWTDLGLAGLFGLVLVWTASTSAWFVGGVALLLVGFAQLRHNWLLVLFVLVVAGLLATWVLAAASESELVNSLSQTFLLRFVHRLQTDPLESIELDALAVLLDSDWMLFTGAGLGGISFYIAERIGFSDLILTPNNGVLNLLCSVGLIGASALAIFAFAPTASFLLRHRNDTGHYYYCALLGLIGLIQYLVFAISWITILSFASFLAAYQLAWWGEAKISSANTTRPSKPEQG